MSTVYAYARFVTVEAFFAEQEACDCTALDETEDAALVADALDFGSDILARLSGMRYRGIITRTDWRPRLECGACGPYCITMPEDLVSITSIKRDGVTLVEGTDWVRRGRKLYRLNTEGFPSSWGRQEIWRPLTEEDTLAITFIQGRTPGMMEKAALYEAACDAIKAWTGGAQPLLRGVDSISGGGVNINRDPDEDGPIAEQMPSVARFTQFWNPGGQALPNEVYSPDLGTDCGICSCG